MKSLNFEFLRPMWPELAGLGGFAETYAHPDPVGSITKLRVFGEQVVDWIHHHQVLDDDNGKPLAVLEAKRTSKNPAEGRKQAELYADALEKKHGQRPVIFYTNGYDLWIWNDAAGEPPRKIYGFYSKDSLQHLHFQRTAKKPVTEVAANAEIAGRMYQIEAVRRVVERFSEKKRKALIVQATGTGKTRVAISLCDAMVKANWARRILFLCDRRELRRQANTAFNEFLASLPRTYVSGATAGNSKDRIFLATYPAMMKIYQSFDPGFFDLIIADESHRSLYNRYRQLFEYFDCYQLGLTATPVDFVARNTFSIFGCDEGDPTSNYDYPTAVAQKHLVPFEVDTHTTPFLRSGIKYSKMTEEQRRQLEEDEVLPQAIDFGQVEAVSSEETVRQFDAATRATLQRNIAPLMQWVDIGKFEEAYKFDRLIAQLQTELIRGGGRFADLRDAVVNLVSSLRINLSQVKVKLPVIERVKSQEFWDQVTVGDLEEIRDQLRGIIQFRRKDEGTPFEPITIDVKEDEADVERKKHKVRLDKLDDLDMVAYRNRVNNVLQAIIDQNDTLKKIRLGQPVTPQDLEDLCSLVLTQEPKLDLHNLMDDFQQAESLDQAIREIIGMDADAVHQRFTKFVQAHPNLASHQIKFLDLLQNHIAKFGSIKTDDLYEPPFTTLHSDSLDGLFDESLADELFEIIHSFQAMKDSE